MNEKIISFKTVDKYLRHVGCNWPPYETQIALALYHFGVKEIYPSYRWESGNEKDIRNILVDDSSLICSPNISVETPPNMAIGPQNEMILNHTPLLWYVLKSIGVTTGGGAGDGFMQVYISRIPRNDPTKRQDRDTLAAFTNRILGAFVAIKHARR